ncbi:MAG: hypothetical protein H7061_01950 [Bdellovibrionaceae bacterium]|nr:hypothetical protein [Bdellovibrio sp.]
MKYFILMLTALSFQIAQAGNIIGTWQFLEYKYEDKIQPAPNPDLDLRFTFTEKGEAYLKWFRTDETGFCQRKADYKIQGDVLWQKVVWLNPNNDMKCGEDPDMQINQETKTKFTVTLDRLNLDIGLQGKSFIYILHAVSGDASVSGDISVSSDGSRAARR